jgi:ABC-type lipoprotein release transport system permease subunit
MNWITLSWREWQRRPFRTAITLAGVAISTAALFSLLSFQQGYADGVRQELDRLGAHILVVPKGCPYDAASIALHGASWPCYLKAAYLDEVRSTPGVRAAAPALMAAFYDTVGGQTVYVGIDTNMLQLKPGWRITGAFPREAGELLIGSDVSRKNAWQPGQQVALPGLSHQSGIVRGVLSPTHGAEDAFIFLRLADTQAQLHHPGELTHILVRLNDPDQLESVVAQLRGCDAGLYMNVVPVAHLFHTIQGVVSSTRLLLGCLAVVALLVAGAGVGNTLLMAVAERTREIGVLRALGASQRQIFQLFWLQTLEICLAGAIVGMLAAFLSSRAVETWIRGRLPFAPSESLIQWQGSIALTCLGCALLVGSLAGLLPAWRAGQLSPVEAMRRRGGT